MAGSAISGVPSDSTWSVRGRATICVFSSSSAPATTRSCDSVGHFVFVLRRCRIVDSTRRAAKARAASITRASSAFRTAIGNPARATLLRSPFAALTIRCKSAFRYFTSCALSAVTADNSAGHNPPVTHGVQSTGELKAGILSDSRAALRKRCRAVIRPKISTGQAYRQRCYTTRQIGSPTMPPPCLAHRQFAAISPPAPGQCISTDSRLPAISRKNSDVYLIEARELFCASIIGRHFCRPPRDGPPRLGSTQPAAE